MAGPQSLSSDLQSKRYGPDRGGGRGRFLRRPGCMSRWRALSHRTSPVCLPWDSCSAFNSLQAPCPPPQAGPREGTQHVCEWAQSGGGIPWGSRCWARRPRSGTVVCHALCTCCLDQPHGFPATALRGGGLSRAATPRPRKTAPLHQAPTAPCRPRSGVLLWAPRRGGWGLPAP